MFLKRLSPRTLFSLTSSSSPSPYSTSSLSHITYPPSFTHPGPGNVRVSVWWDLEACNVPSGLNVFRGAQAIAAAIESSGIKGPIYITAFVDILRLATTNQEALSSTAINFTGKNFTGINFTHVPHGGEYNAHRLFGNLMNWVSKNPPPAHLFLITVDEGSSSVLHHLRKSNYNILLATKESASGFLRMASTIVWNWDDLVRGENLTGRYFNQSPNSNWYGHYEGPLEDPFTEIEKAALIPDNQPSEIFSQDSFWRDMRTFINSDVGSFIIAESTTRKKMAHYLLKYGPSVFHSVPKSEILLLVNMLISEKKWVLESPNLIRPFKLTSAAGITSANSDIDDFSDSELDCSDDFSDSE